MKQFPAVVLIVGILIIVGVTTQWPVMLIREQNLPKADPKYIRRVYGPHTIGQQFELAYTVNSLEILLRSVTPVEAVLTLRDEQARVQATRSVSLTNEEAWVRFTLAHPLSPGSHTLTLQAPDLAVIDSAALVRFQIQSELFPEGHMVVEGRESYGDVAMRFYQRLPLWRAVIVWGQITSQTLIRGLKRLGLGLIFAGALIMTTQLRWRRWPTVSTWLPVIVLMLFALAIRLPYAHAIEGIFGGDAVNYLSKAYHLLHGEDPFAADPRKGPLFSLLLLPGFFMTDPLLWSRWVGMAAAALSSGLVPFLGKRLGLPWPLAVVSGLLLAVNQEFVWESASGLANSLFTLVIVASALAVTRPWLLAALLGLTTLTRYEGVGITLVWLPWAWIRNHTSWQRISISVLVAVGIIAIPFVSYVWSGVSGIRTVDDITTDSGLWLVRSVDDLRANVALFRQFLTQLWVFIEYPVAVGRWLLLGGVLGVMGWQREQRAMTVIGLIMLSIFILTKSTPAREWLTVILLILTGAGMGYLLRTRWRDTGPIALGLLALTSLIVLILPKSRYFLPLIPFLSLALVSGVVRMLGWSSSKLHRVGVLVFVSLLASFFHADGARTLRERTEWYNAKSQDSIVMIDALRYLRRRATKVGFITVEDAAFVYIQPRNLFEFSAQGDTEVAIQEAEWIKQHRVRYLIERDRDPQWSSVRQYPDAFERSHVFDTIHGDSKVFVYTVKHNKLP